MPEMKRELDIEISGPIGSGKTTVAALVYRFLEDLGFDVCLNDAGSGYGPKHHHPATRLELIKEINGRIPASVSITTIKTRKVE